MTRPRPLGLLCVLVLAFPVTAAGQEQVTLFVTSEKMDVVSVYRGLVPDLARVATIPVGREPHNLGISPDGRWVAASDRRSGEVSVIDTRTLTEAARLKLGRQTHDVAFTADGRALFVGHETETFVSVVEVGSWSVRPPLRIGRAQHDLSISSSDRELWFTVTNRPYKRGDPRVGVAELATGTVTLIDTGANAHDVTLSPDGTVAWVTNSGFTHLPDARVDLLEVATRRVLGSLTVGRYPFHSPKRGRDGNAVPQTATEMWFSDHGLRSLVAVSLADRRVVATVPVGVEPYHVTATPRGVLFVANHTSNTVTIVDGPRRTMLSTLAVPPRPHGLAVLVDRTPGRGGALETDPPQSRLRHVGESAARPESVAGWGIPGPLGQGRPRPGLRQSGPWSTLSRCFAGFRPMTPRYLLCTGPPQRRSP